MSLDINIELPRRDFTMKLNLSIGNKLTGIYGHSGAGKTSLLHLIAGLEKPSKGTIKFNGKTIVDQWRVVDLKTDKDKAIMEIYEKDGQYFAKIIKLLGMTDEEAAAEVCNKCQDDRKGQQLLGMEIISGLKKGDDKFEGKIIDLQKGKVYKAVVWLENEDRLKVRTMVPIIFKDLR